MIFPVNFFKLRIDSGNNGVFQVKIIHRARLNFLLIFKTLPCSIYYKFLNSMEMLLSQVHEIEACSKDIKVSSSNLWSPTALELKGSGREIGCVLSWTLPALHDALSRLSKAGARRDGLDGKPFQFGGPYSLCVKLLNSVVNNMQKNEHVCVSIKLYKNRWWARGGQFAIA